MEQSKVIPNLGEKALPELKLDPESGATCLWHFNHLKCAGVAKNALPVVWTTRSSEKRDIPFDGRFIVPVGGRHNYRTETAVHRKIVLTVITEFQWVDFGWSLPRHDHVEVI